MGNKKDIPEGWLDYSPLGKQIPGTIIICFKVPLKEELARKIPESKRFTPSMLMSKVPNLAGIIDVTNTPRYYNKQVFLDKGILHEKIQCPGHAVPPADVVIYFQKIMEKMWTTAESARGKLVGVHCTHGINRTGYLVCRYLIECRGFQPEEAIRLFAEGRGHGIERQNYLSDLMTLTPGHRSPASIPHAEFMKMEEKRRAYWNTDAPNESLRPRHNRHENGTRHSPRPSTVVHGLSTPPPPQYHCPPAPPHSWLPSATHHHHHPHHRPGNNSQWHRLQGQQPLHHMPHHHEEFTRQEWGSRYGVASSSSYQPWYHPEEVSVGHGSAYGEEHHYYGSNWHSRSPPGGPYHDSRSRGGGGGSRYSDVYYRGQQQRRH